MNDNSTVTVFRRQTPKNRLNSLIAIKFRANLASVRSRSKAGNAARKKIRKFDPRAPAASAARDREVKILPCLSNELASPADTRVGTSPELIRKTSPQIRVGGPEFLAWRFRPGIVISFENSGELETAARACGQKENSPAPDARGWERASRNFSTEQRPRRSPRLPLPRPAFIRGSFPEGKLTSSRSCVAITREPGIRGASSVEVELSFDARWSCLDKCLVNRAKSSVEGRFRIWTSIEVNTLSATSVARD